MKIDDPERRREVVNAVALRLGFHAEAGDRDRLAQAVGERMAALHCRSHAQYLQRLASVERGDEELRALADALIIGETYFFRGRDHLQVISEVLLPQACAAAPLRLLSAGCASGEEPYTLAIIADQLGVADAVCIHGVDVNPRALQRAQAGRYSAWSMRDTPESVRQRYFHSEERSFVLDAALRARVEFRECNLLDAQHPLWSGPSYHAILCRNVLIYFSPAVISEVVRRLGGLLEEGGYLFLGHSETLHAAAPGLRLCSSHDTVYYRRSAEQPVAPPALELAQASTALIEVEPRLPRPSRRPSLTPRGNGAPPINDALVESVLQLVRLERYAEALERLQRAAQPSFSQSRLRAELLYLTGRLDEAEAACAELLRQRFLDAELQMLAALCREQAGDATLAAEHARRASYLDPRSALPHLLLGRLARRGGQDSAAVREFEAARERLPRDDEQRLLMLGGGFGRAALIQYCESQIAACRGRHG